MLAHHASCDERLSGFHNMLKAYGRFFFEFLTKLRRLAHLFHNVGQSALFAFFHTVRIRDQTPGSAIAY
jgi:hypothetical protein